MPEEAKALPQTPPGSKAFELQSVGQSGASVTLNEHSASTQSRADLEQVRAPCPRIEKILVATDFSPGAAKAIQKAVSLARESDATLTVLHVIDVNAQPPPGQDGPAATFMRELRTQGSLQLGRLALLLSSELSAQARLEEGLPWEQIVERSASFDLVVLGKSPTKSAWRLFASHTAERVMQQAHCPVLVV